MVVWGGGGEDDTLGHRSHGTLRHWLHHASSPTTVRCINAASGGEVGGGRDTAPAMNTFKERRRRADFHLVHIAIVLHACECHLSKRQSSCGFPSAGCNTHTFTHTQNTNAWLAHSTHVFMGWVISVGCSADLFVRPSRLSDVAQQYMRVRL